MGPFLSNGILLQNNRPVAYGSKPFTKTQRAWAQIETQLYAIVYGCAKLHKYVLGKPIDVESDHKPLESILKKIIGNIHIRLQRMRLWLQPYDIRVCYKPGKEMYLADTLSRSYCTVEPKEDDDLYN